MDNANSTGDGKLIGYEDASDNCCDVDTGAATVMSGEVSDVVVTAGVSSTRSLLSSSDKDIRCCRTKGFDSCCCRSHKKP